MPADHPRSGWTQVQHTSCSFCNAHAMAASAGWWSMSTAMRQHLLAAPAWQNCCLAQGSNHSHIVGVRWQWLVPVAGWGSVAVSTWRPLRPRVQHILRCQARLDLILGCLKRRQALLDAALQVV